MDYIKSLVSSDKQATPETHSQRRKRLEAELEASKNPTSFADTLTTYATTAYETVAEGAGYVVKNAQEYFNKDGTVNENSDEAKRRAKETGEYGCYARVRKDQKYPQNMNQQRERRSGDGRIRQDGYSRGHKPESRDLNGYSNGYKSGPREILPPRLQSRQERTPPRSPQLERPPRFDRQPLRAESSSKANSTRPPARQQSRSSSQSQSHKQPEYEDGPTRGRWAHKH